MPRLYSYTVEIDLRRPDQETLYFSGPGVESSIQGHDQTTPERICQLLEWAYTAGVRAGARALAGE